MKTARSLILLLLLITLGGCGVDWFPKFERKPTTPDLFSFPAKTGVAENTTVTSDPITVSGITESSPISVTGSVGSNSTYSINGAAPTASAGFVNNGDKVTVQHTSASALATDTTTTLFIGDVSATFVSTTVPVLIPAFTPVTAAPGNVVTTSVTLTARDGIAGTHVVSISNGFYSLDSVNFFSNVTQTIPVLNGRVIFLRATASTTPGATVDVVLTIDGVSSTWTVTTQ